MIVPNDPARSFGLNSFEIQLDPFDSIRELSKLNNRARIELFINKKGSQNLFPYNYSIVSTDSVVLTVQESTLSESTRQFQFELDTSGNFSGSVLPSRLIEAKWLAEWDINPFEYIPREDSLVFFWRTRFTNAQPGEQDIWSTNSYTYIENGPEGWAQSHPHQLQENSNRGLNYDQISNQWKFNTYQRTIEVTTFGVNHPEKDYEDIVLKINGSAYIYNTRLCTDNSLNAIAFDRITTDPYKALDFDVLYDILDRRTCGRQPQVINNILNNEIVGSPDYLRKYIDAVKEGDRVLIFTIGQVNFQSWPQEIKEKLLEVGVSPAAIDGLTDGDPLIILGQKGADEGSAIIISADETSGTPADEQEISLTTEIEGQATSGSITTDLIGPAASGQQFQHGSRIPDSPGEESYHFSIYGRSSDNVETLLFDNIQNQNLNISNIDPSDYPYLRLTFRTSDTITLTPVQLRYWMVLYDPLPEGIILPADNQPLSGISVQEGESYRADFRFRNIGKIEFTDSVTVLFELSSQETLVHYMDSLRIKSPTTQSETDFSISLPTRNQAGKNDLMVNANPMIIPEQSYINNRLNLPEFLIVKPDNIHPTIDVAFDGRYILDGEIVAPSPLISVHIKDENKILLKEDTTGITLSLKRPGEDQFNRIAFTDPNLNWSPASEKKDFSIEYQPPPLSDGIYTLSVQAEDASGNEAGTEPYEIRFEVINESQITHFYPFPNPFSTSTRFVFTLTGSIIPEEIKIQIMTVSGKVVREIMADEIGPIHIGNNITEYAWNGRDEFGDQLANGVYLYRVIINNPGDNFKHRETTGDRAFRKNFGKLYILR
jgi:hypothetical protein